MRQASSYGLGEQVKAALDAGCRHLIIGLGGSATNDGGIGFAQALGARFWRKDDPPPAPAAGQDLAHIQRIDSSGLDPRLQQSEIQASCDVTNPLLGEHGATWVYGAQKGADEAALSELEAGMAHYSQLLTQTLGFDVSERPGAGAAGGMGAALIAYTGATLRPGIDLVLELLNADDHLRDAALTIVGEGWLDRQSALVRPRWAWQAKPHAMACRLWPFAAGVMRAAGNYINTILTQCGLFASALWRWQSR